jgi:hypothetical protein
MLMESEHNMAREDRDGSGTEMVFMAFVSFWVTGKCLEGHKNRENNLLDSPKSRDP